MSVSVIRDAIRKAKKEWRCIWCYESILIGETHHQQVVVMDGEIQDNRYHAECWKVAEEAFQNGDDEFMPGSFRRGTEFEK